MGSVAYPFWSLFIFIGWDLAIPIKDGHFMLRTKHEAPLPWRARVPSLLPPGTWSAYWAPCAVDTPMHTGARPAFPLHSQAADASGEERGERESP